MPQKKKFQGKTAENALAELEKLTGSHESSINDIPSDAQINEQELEAKLKDEEKLSQLANELKQPAEEKKETKAKAQAIAGRKLLEEKGEVTIDDLKTINSKYPQDVVFYMRRELSLTIDTIREKGQPTKYKLQKLAA